MFAMNACPALQEYQLIPDMIPSLGGGLGTCSSSCPALALQVKALIKKTTCLLKSGYICYRMQLNGKSR